MSAPWYYQQRQYPVAEDDAPAVQGAFGRAGYPATLQSPTPGVCIVVVSLPPWLPQAIDPYALPPQGQPGRRGLHFGASPASVQFAAVVLVLAIFGYLAYAMLGGRDAIPATVPADYRNLWANIIDGIGLVLLAALGLAIIWMARKLAPMVTSLLGRRGK